MTPEPAPFRHDLADGPEGARAWWIRCPDGVRLRVGHFPAGGDRGTVLLFPGRTEYIEKYGRTARDLVARGFDVLAVDWRGQGMADRLVDDPLTGHVQDFEDYQTDVDAVLKALRDLGLPEPLYLLAHSMGGCIGLRALLRRIPVQAAAFTGPMWGIHMASVMRPAAWALSWSGSRTGLGHRYVPGTKPASYVASEPFENNVLTSDREMFDYMRGQVTSEPSFRLGGPSLRWLGAALAECRALAAEPSPPVPCVTFVGVRERIVDTDRIRDRMTRWPQARLVYLEGAEHEVLMEDPATRAWLADEAAALYGACKGTLQPRISA